MVNKVANMTFYDQKQVKNQNPGHYRQLTEILLLILTKIMCLLLVHPCVPQSDLRINALIMIRLRRLIIHLKLPLDLI